MKWPPLPGSKWLPAVLSLAVGAAIAAAVVMLRPSMQKDKLAAVNERMEALLDQVEGRDAKKPGKDADAGRSNTGGKQPEAATTRSDGTKAQAGQAAADDTAVAAGNGGKDTSGTGETQQREAGQPVGASGGGEDSAGGGRPASGTQEASNTGRSGTPAKTPAPNKREKQGGKINLNEASVAELTKLPGIGESKAKAIVAYREQHGGYRSTQELTKVKGIGDKTFAKLKELISV